MKIWLSLAIAATLLVSAVAAAADDDEKPADRTLPGLIFMQLPPEGSGRKLHLFVQVEPVPRLFGKEGDSGQFALPWGPQRVMWAGFLEVPSDGDYVFTALRNTLKDFKFGLGDKPVELGKSIKLARGRVKLRIEGTSQTGPLGFDLWWRSAAFDDEPIAGRYFRYEPTDVTKLSPSEFDEPNTARAIRGAILAELYGCFGCHSGPATWTESLGNGRAGLAGPKLDRAGFRYNKQWIYDQLTHPEKHPGGRMPGLFGEGLQDELAALTIASFLSTRGASDEPDDHHGSAQNGRRLYVANGCGACHAPPDAAKAGTILTTPAPKLEGLAAKWSYRGLAAFLQNPLECRPHGRMPDFNLTTVQAADLAEYLLVGPQAGVATPKGPEFIEAPLTERELRLQWQDAGGDRDRWSDIPVDDRLGAVAFRLMGVRQCFGCHEVDRDRLARDMKLRTISGEKTSHIGPLYESPLAPRLANITGVQDVSGCLAIPGQTGRAPRFRWTEEERHSLFNYCDTLATTTGRSTSERLRVDMALLNCVRCHENEGRGGASLESLLGGHEAAKYVLPPALDQVGARVLPERLRNWLGVGAKEEALRPWVGAKMPGFGWRGVRVAAALISRDGDLDMTRKSSDATPVIHAPDSSAHPDKAQLQIGRKLVGLKGLSCINCHQFNGRLLADKEDPTTRGPDLARVAAHFRPEYFYRWVMNPARIDPGTKMPQTILRDGHVGVPGMASMKPPEPMNALWNYLDQGPMADPPTDEPVVLLKPEPGQPVVQRGETLADGNNRYPRGIALGFADGTLLFDAAQLAPVAVWYGGFVQGVEQHYFGLTWSHPGIAAEPLPPEFARLSFKLPGSDDWQSYPLPIDSDPNDGSRFDGYFIGKSAIRLRYRLLVGGRQVSVTEDIAFEGRLPEWNGFARSFKITGLPDGAQASLVLSRAQDYERWTALGKTAGAVVTTVTETPLATFRQPDGAGTFHAVRLSGAGAEWREFGVKEKTQMRLVSAPVESGHVIAFAVDAWTYRGNAVTPNASAMEQLVRLPIDTRDHFMGGIMPPQPISEPAAATSDKAAAATSKSARPTVNHRMNVEDFAPVKAKFVRMKILAVQDNAEPGIDELEIYGADPSRNLALAGKATASSLTSHDKHYQIRYLNDGRLGNDRAWVGDEKGTGWVAIELPAATEVQRVVWGRDRNGASMDRLATQYVIETSLDGTNWIKAADGSDRDPYPGNGLVRADASPGYRMESIPAPFPGIRPSGIAFGPEGQMYVIAMTEGQIWRTKTPPPDHPEQVHWTRYASGLAHPIGLTFNDGRLFVCQKPEITELIDHAGHGVVDEYRTVAAGWNLSLGFHEYAFGLEADRQKNLYFALNTGHFWSMQGYANYGRYRGSVMRIAWPSERLEEVAKGCRVPNGVVRGPDGDMFFTDNQGDWIQVCKLAHIVPGRFYGHPEHYEDALPKGKYPNGEAAVWLPYELSRSTSGPVFDETAGKFGPFAGQFFVGDVGYGANPGVMRVALEKVDGEYQGASFRWCDGQPLGCQRMTYGPDNQLYMVSLTTGLTRMRFVGPPPLAIHSVNIRAGGKGFVVNLTKPLAADAKLDPAAVQAEHYHYLYTGNYGSPSADVTKVNVSTAELSADRRSITLSLPVETYPIGMVYEINVGKLTADGGETLQQNDFWYTVNRIPK